MEYHQITLNEWMEMKEAIRRELNNVKHSFVRVGYYLRRAEEEELYKQDGYNSLADFAKSEYGLNPSAVSRFIAINRKYSVDGYSPALLPEYEDYKQSVLVEMLALPDSDLQMITPETPREDVRELKRFNSQDIGQETGEAEESCKWDKLIRMFFGENKDLAIKLAGMADAGDKDLIETLNPSGSRTYRSGIYFMAMSDKDIKIKQIGKAPEPVTYRQFLDMSKAILREITDQDEGRVIDEGSTAEEEAGRQDPPEAGRNREDNGGSEEAGVGGHEEGGDNPKGGDGNTYHGMADAGRAGSGRDSDQGDRVEADEAGEEQEKEGQQEADPVSQEGLQGTDGAEKGNEEVDKEEASQNTAVTENISSEAVQEETGQETGEIESKNAAVTDSVSSEGTSEDGNTHCMRVAADTFMAMVRGKRNFDLRDHPEKYKVGDKLYYQEFIDGRFSGRTMTAKITFKLTNAEGLKDGFCILALGVC